MSKLTFFIFLCIILQESWAIDSRALVESVADTMNYVSNVGVPPLICANAQNHNENRPYCHPALMQAAAIHYNLESQSYPTSDSSLKHILHRQGLTITGRIFGKSIETDYNKARLTADVQAGDDIQFQFTPRRGFHSLTGVNKGREGSCAIEDCNAVDEKVARTMEMMRRLSPEQREAWVNFCKEYPEYEARARSMRDSSWSQIVDDKVDSYRGCAPNLNWKRVSAWGLCGGAGDAGFPLYSPDVFETFGQDLFPKAILFHFDGYGDFKASHAKLLGAVNLRGDEPGEPILGWQNANGLRFYDRTLSSMMENDQDFNLSQIQLHYHDGADSTPFTGEDGAIACHEDMQRWLDAIGPLVPNFSRPRVMAMGFSNGGAAALNFQREIGRNDRELDLLITLDPIPRPGRFLLRGLLPTDLLPSRHENTRRHINYYQDIDYGSMQGLKLRSNALNSADMNYKVEPQDWGGTDGNRAHLRFLRAPLLQSNVSCELGRVVNPSLDFCY